MLNTLIQQFRTAIINDYQSLEKGDSEAGNRYAKEVIRLHHDILKFGEEGKSALISLVDDENVFIRAKAAFYSLPYVPEKAEKLLKQISNEPGFVGFISKQAVDNWKKGVFKNIEEL